MAPRTQKTDFIRLRSNHQSFPSLSIYTQRERKVRLATCIKHVPQLLNNLWISKHESVCPKITGNTTKYYQWFILPNYSMENPGINSRRQFFVGKEIKLLNSNGVERGICRYRSQSYSSKIWIPFAKNKVLNNPHLLSEKIHLLPLHFYLYVAV